MQDPFAHGAELVRATDRDRFIASLFAPAEHRGAICALYAFNSEVSRVRETAREALPGEIRLQWWSDVINRDRDEEARANPVAAALLTTIERYRLSSAKLVDLIEARRFDLYDDPMAALADLEAYASKTSSALFALAAQILAGANVEAVTTPAGIASRLPACCAPFRSMRRGGSFMCRWSFWTVIRSARMTYSPAVPRRVYRRRSPSYATSAVATSTRHISRWRRCRLLRCRPCFRWRWCGLRSCGWRVAIRSRPPKSRPGGGNG